MPPRAQLTIRTPGRQEAIWASPTRCRVWGVSGVWMVMKSERWKISSSGTTSIRERFTSSAETNGSICDHRHVEGERPVRHLASHLAEAHDAQRLALKLRADEPPALPRSGSHRAVGRGNPARHRQQHAERMLGSRDGVAPRDVHHHNAPPRGGLQVDVVHPGARAANHAEPLGGINHLRRDLCLAAHHQGGVAADDCEQLPGRQTGPVVHREILLRREPVERPLRDLVADQDPAHRVGAHRATPRERNRSIASSRG